MKKYLCYALLGFLLMLGFQAVVTGPAVATGNGGHNECTPSDGTDPVFGDWSWASFTEWQTSPDAPADPDGQSGDDNLLNVSKIGERYERTVTDHEAYDDPDVIVPGTPSQWWNWSPNHQQGPFDGPPAFPTDPRGTWQGPHTNGGPDGEGTFNTSNNDNGRASWFHREPGTPDTTTPGEHHDAVTHVEYRWSIYERTNTPGTDPVECPPVDTEVTPPTFEPTGPDCDNPSTVTVPVTEHIATTLYGVPGQAETPITAPVTVTGDQVSQFWIGYVADEGYVLNGAGTTHIDGLLPKVTGGDCEPPPVCEPDYNGDEPGCGEPEPTCEDTPELCPVDITIPFPEPTQHDRCGKGNAGWNQPDDSVWLSWVLEDDGSLTAITNDGYVFPDGSTLVNFGQPVDSGAKCQVGPPPEKPQPPQAKPHTPVKQTLAPPVVLPNTGANDNLRLLGGLGFGALLLGAIALVVARRRNTA